jgi:hypothetical protein
VADSKPVLDVPKTDTGDYLIQTRLAAEAALGRATKDGDERAVLTLRAVIGLMSYASVWRSPDDLPGWLS